MSPKYGVCLICLFTVLFTLFSDVIRGNSSQTLSLGVDVRNGMDSVARLGGWGDWLVWWMVDSNFYLA